MPSTPTVASVSASNKALLRSFAQSDESWRGYLATLSQHVGCLLPSLNQSALNCAAIAGSGYADTRAAMTLDEWRSMPGCAQAEPVAGARGILVVKQSKRDANAAGQLFRVDELLPPSALVGIGPSWARHLPRRVDLGDPALARVWERAVAGLYVESTDEDGGRRRDPLNLGDLSDEARFVILSHFQVEATAGTGIPEVSAPTADVAGDPSAIKRHVNEVISESKPVCSQLERSLNGLIRREMTRHREDSEAGRRHRMAGAADEEPSRPQPSRSAPAGKPAPFLPFGKAPADAFAAAKRAAAASGQASCTPRGVR